MNGDLLSSSFDKVQWARGHAKGLNKLIEDEVRSKTYQLSHEFNRETRYFQIVWDPPPLDAEFGLRIGDAIQCLRSALDHAIWELTARNNIDPESLRNPRPEFPIEITEQLFRDRRGPQKIRGTADEIQQVVRDNQPYIRGDHATEDELAVLDDLANADKHRLITPVRAAVEINHNAIEQVLADNIEFIEPGYFVTPTGRLFKPRQDVVRFRPVSGRTPKMDVEVEAEADVAFEEGALVIPTLNAIGIRVEGVIRHLVNATG